MCPQTLSSSVQAQLQTVLLISNNINKKAEKSLKIFIKAPVGNNQPLTEISFTTSELNKSMSHSQLNIWMTHAHNYNFVKYQAFKSPQKPSNLKPKLCLSQETLWTYKSLYKWNIN